MSNTKTPEELLATIQSLLEAAPDFDGKKRLRELVGDALTFSPVGSDDKEGVRLVYPKRMRPWEIINQVKPKQYGAIAGLSVRIDDTEPVNELVEGENLSAMVTLYKYRGQVDLILTDPPYNTGKDFRYNDKWDSNPDSPDLGDLVKEDDGSRHAKWLRFMAPRLWMMREMLKPKGVLAICIDHRELYRLGCLLDDIFGEDNRIGLINWQKSYSPKSDSRHMSTATEYVLVYAKDIARAKTGLEERTAEMDARYTNPDDDPQGAWASSDPCGRGGFPHPSDYGIQNPFTGAIVYPTGNAHWAHERKKMKEYLEGWGVKYKEKDLKDGKHKALVLAIPLPEAQRLAKERLAKSAWPRLIFLNGGAGGPRLKRYLADVKQGKVPLSYWASEAFEDSPENIGTTSWPHKESGHSQAGVNELTAVVGRGHGFETVKPLKLMKKIIQLWCPPDGIVMDPFAGSGTTGHAVLELNKEAGTSRRFVLMEQGNSDKGDHYARTLTADRLRRVVTGDWASGSREGTGQGFRYLRLYKKVNAKAIRALEREELADLLIVSYWNHSERARSSLNRIPPGTHKHLFAKNAKNEGFFLVWDGTGDSDVTRKVYDQILDEVEEHELSSKVHVYAGTCSFSGPNIEFYQIPDKVLEYLNFDARRDSYDDDEEEAA